MHWPGFRKVRRQVCRRVARRTRELGLPGLGAYRAHLEANPDEWHVLDGLCHVTVSRFYRDRSIFDALGRDVLPALASSAGTELDVWSAGCASGEEPYSVALVWKLGLAPRFPDRRLRVLATDVDDAVLRRAERGCYGTSSLRDLPEALRSRGFVECEGLCCARPEVKEPVSFLRHDVRAGPPEGRGPFDLVLCRNLVFTYFDLELQRELAGGFAACLRPGGALVVGAHEELPAGVASFAPWPERPGIFRRT
jgi:chemotaxis protein methyltransferase CheR